eukprot:CAMPEP_0168498412 /NCGR_PEP_ID=MMETSP0228-20121227/73264_1 /TAXON_ID=133427 /ORGANISM="Protoceratium reticulatum, Strain CCCM 535 (=CCMP 1889)" /LENGTH=42 /DNA_ID= /DNA_START= /DNA_END= /DNA_ORIENTATION=
MQPLPDVLCRHGSQLAQDLNYIEVALLRWCPIVLQRETADTT